LRAHSAAQRVVERAAAVRHARAHREHALDRALGHEVTPAADLGRDAEALAREVIGNLAQFHDARGIVRCVLEDRLVERIREPLLQSRVARGPQVHVGRARACDVDRAFERDDAFGERAGLVGAQDVHAAQVLDRGEAPHEHAVAGHALRAAREVDADDRGQQLGRQTDGQRDREQERLDHRSMEGDVQREHGERHHQHHAREQVAEARHRAIELGLGCAQLQALGDRAVLGLATGAHDQHARDAAAHRGAHEDAVGALAERRRRIRDAGAFVDGVGFAGQHRFADEEIVGLDQDAVAGHQAARGEHGDVSRHDFGESDRARSSIAHQRRLEFEPRAQAFERSSGAVLAPEAEQARHRDDREHHSGVGPLLQRARERGRGYEDQHQRTAELPSEHTQRRERARTRQLVASMARQPLGRRGRRQPGRARRQAIEQRGERLGPVALRRHALLGHRVASFERRRHRAPGGRIIPRV
jgi:hypothetical protein